MELPVLIFDADPAVYRAAFASQSTVHDCVYETKSGEVKQRIWGDGREKLKFFRRYPTCTLLSCEQRTQPQPINHARQAVHTIFKRSIDKALEHFGLSDVNQMNMEVLLSGPANFRKDIATIAVYKGNRKAELPHWYQVCRDTITESYGATVVNGWEADDQVSIRARQLEADGIPYIVATIDKDLDQIPGVHYDYRQHVFYDVNKFDAEMFFWKQCLTGDSTDNIPGCYRVGDGAAEKLLAKWTEDYDGDPFFDAEQWRSYLWGRVVQHYGQVMARYPDKYPEGMAPGDAALETARLVHMMHYEHQLWTPPGEADETLPEVTREV